jgi:hypothetical protein
MAEQLGWLISSCKLFDAGDHSEGKRLGTTIRTIFKDGRGITSLLSHLDAWDRPVLTTAEILRHPEHVVWWNSTMVGTLVGAQARFFPMLGRGPFTAFVPARFWWTQPVAIPDQGVIVTRSEIVLTANEKDGGGHVDKKLTRAYELLAGPTWHVSQSFDGGPPVERTLDGIHLFYLRQMAYEVLSSRSLWDLAGTVPQAN